MSVFPIATSFVVALAGAMVVGLGPGYPIAPLLFDATIAAAMTGILATVLEFLARRHFAAAAIVVGSIAGVLVAPLLGITTALGTAETRDAVVVVWPVAIVAGLLASRASGMGLPSLRRRRRVRPHH